MGSTTRIRLAVALGLVVAGCGRGGATSPTAPPAATADPTRLVVLDAGNFDALVLAPERPSLVKFQSPT